MNANATWLIPLVAYLLGSIPFGLLIVKASGGGDIRASGSGNIGAANVTRNAGLLAGLLTLLLDAAKGYLAVWLAARWTGSSIRWMMAAAVCAVLGHMFPIWLGFRGGKGVATGLGVFLPICPEAVGFALLLWLAMGWQTGALFAVGAAISIGSIYEWGRLFRHIAARMDGKKNGRGSGFGTVTVVGLFLLRLVLFAGVIYGSLKCFHGSPIALLCGLGLALAGLVWEALRVLRG